MYEDLFTVYNKVDPPAGFKNKTDFDIPEIAYTSVDFGLPQEVDSQTDDFLSIYNMDNPFKETQETSFNFVYPEATEEKVETPTEKVVLKGSAQFEKALEEAIKINPEVAKYRNFLVKTAKLESGFNSHIQNTAGAPYYGYFQMGKSEIQNTTGLSVEEFRNNPVQQILGAIKLYNMNLKTLKAIGAYELCKGKGFTDDAMVAGSWLGGPGGVKKFIKGLGDPSDSHWYGGTGGTSVGKRMKEFNNYS